MKLLGSIKNGNYNIHIFEDGTKIRENDLDFFDPEKPESMDIKITNKCDKGCPFCHENSLPNGEHGDIMNLKFLDTLLPYTELAIGGGNPLEHPDLVPFLQRCKELKLIPNITVNQAHFEKNAAEIDYLVKNKLIYGLGISLVLPTKSFIKQVKKYPNAVIHMINGIHTPVDYKTLYDNELKILILGYKEFRRGLSYHNEYVDHDKELIYDLLPEIVKHFKAVSFDNLALKQLDVKRLLSDQQWEEFYMGDDGSHTMYIDCVKKTFSKSSTTPEAERQPMLDDIKPMFDYVRRH